MDKRGPGFGKHLGGILLAALSVPVTTYLIWLALHLIGLQEFQIGHTYYAFQLLVLLTPSAFIVLVVLGLPAMFLVRTRGVVNYRSMVPVGAATGFIVLTAFVVVFRWQHLSPMWFLISLPFFLQGAVMGGMAAAVWVWVIRPEPAAAPAEGDL